MDIWQDTTLGDSDMTQKLVQLFIVTNGKLKVTRNDTRLLVVTSCVACQFENFGSKIFKNSGKINRSTFSEERMLDRIFHPKKL